LDKKRVRAYVLKFNLIFQHLSRYLLSPFVLNLACGKKIHDRYYARPDALAYLKKEGFFDLYLYDKKTT